MITRMLNLSRLTPSPFCATALLGLALAPAIVTGQTVAVSPIAPGVVEEHLMIPMRDGTRLSAYLYRPSPDVAGNAGPWPVLYQQRYADVTNTGSRRQHSALAAKGYVVCVQNFRGAQQSEGTFDGYRALGWGERQDGYDTVEWLAVQPWSNGRVGTFGGSQGGYAQNFLAIARPPHLVCQYMVDTGLSLFHEGYRIGGATRPRRLFDGMGTVARDPADGRRWIDAMLAHPTYDDYWAEEDCTRHFDRMNVPCFTIGSWYDFMCTGSVQSFVGRQHRGGPQSRGAQKLLIGPWLHGSSNKRGTKIGELNYPENIEFDLDAHMVRWFDHYLKGIDNGVDREPTVRYYVMGALGEPDAPGNVWREADDFPPQVDDASYFLQAGGLLDRTAPTADASRTTYRSDPARPAPIAGRAFPGARDARSYEAHPDVRTFTTAPLTESVEWTGLVRAELWASSTAPDSDFLVRVSDVYPDGRSILLIDMIQRARYREGYDREVPLPAGNPVKLTLNVGWLSQIFHRGHRIRVTVGSTGADFYEPNPQTGGSATFDLPKEVVIAENAVYHERRHASRLLVPER
jgi:predicted acyl esterase